MVRKYVYLFTEGSQDMKPLLGGKGANLAEMSSIGLPVPPGLTITTEACNQYFAAGRQFPDGMESQLKEKLAEVETAVGKKFGDADDPLLVSVRSGSVISMPGMMDTILNLGLNDQTVQAVAAKSGDARFAYDCYRRFIQMFSDVVLEIEHYHFEQILEEYKHKQGVEFDYQLSAENLQAIVQEYKKLVGRKAGREFPQEPVEQLLLAVRAVFNSWDNQRAKVYRKVNKIPDELGTAVNIQSMVFGNMGSDCGTGVAFTRDPSTGEKVLYGEYLVNAQGEDVVAGIRTPKPIATMQEELPAIYQQFQETCSLLERHYRDVQDVEFTIEKGTLYMLQTRTGKRTAAAAVKIAVEMEKEGLITLEEALARVEPEQLDQLLHRRIDPNAQLEEIAKGLPASPGAASGKVVFEADEAERLADEGTDVLLVSTETTPDDIHGIVAARGVLTSRGGMTSHAAVVARGMGKPCVCGCEGIKIDYAAHQFTTKGGVTVKQGDIISIDGATGRVIKGKVPMIDPQMSEEFTTLLEWADQARRLGIRANADTPEDARKAREFGAEGIGLCRTEHMFMAQERLPIVQEMILAGSEQKRRAALDKLLPMQQEDFYGILKAMEGFPVTIRLLDPPLHEFLPDAEELMVEIVEARHQGQRDVVAAKEELLGQVRSLSEFNPMLGHRGCRLGITFPDVYEMQARAIFQAVVELTREGLDVKPEVEIPLVGHVNELALLRKQIIAVAEQVKEESGVDFKYEVGTMIELPRACATAGEIAAEADFFSFGTNDLTQTTFGFSRDDAEGKFLYHYVDNKILPENPFIVLDRQGVGALMQMAVTLARKEKPGLLVGICGEHGGEPNSIEFCHQIGLDFVSCSPFRVPIARLAAAQAALRA